MRRRIARYALNTLMALSLLLCVATCGLWVRSRHIADQFSRSSSGGVFVFNSTDGVLEFWFSRRHHPWRSYATWQHFTGSSWGGNHAAILGMRHDTHGINPFWIHDWLVVTLTGLGPATYVALRLWNRRPRRPGCCEKCGYDLRATPERCPECGTVAAGH